MRSNAVTEKEMQDLSFEIGFTRVLFEYILESLHGPLSQRRVVGGTRQMLDTISTNKCCKFLAGEGGAIVGHNDLGESMSGDDQPKFLNSGLESRRVDYMSLNPLRV